MPRHERLNIQRPATRLKKPRLMDAIRPKDATREKVVVGKATQNAAPLRNGKRPTPITFHHLQGALARWRTLDILMAGSVNEARDKLFLASQLALVRRRRCKDV